MDLNNIKDHIKDIELDFDQNEVWANIEKEQNKGRRRIFFWLSSVLGGLVLIVGLFYLIDQIPTTDVGIAETVLEENNSVNKKEAHFNSPMESEIDEQIKGGKISTSISDNKNDNESKVSEKYETESGNNISITERIEPNPKRKEIIAKVEMSNDRNITSYDSSFSAQKSVMDAEQNNIFVNSIATENVNAVGVLEHYMAANVYNNTLTPNTINGDLENVSKNDIAVSDEATLSKERMNIFISDIESINVSKPLTYEYSLANIELITINKNIGIEPLRKSNEQLLSVKAIVEYGILNRNISLGNYEMPILALEERERTEKAMDHLITAVNVSMPISKVLYVSSGIEFQRLTEKLEFSENAIRPLTLNDLPPGALATQGFVISNSSSVYYNQLDFINVPMEIGARWSQLRFSEFVSIGTSINLKTSGRQLYLTEFQELLDNADSIKKKFNNSYALRAGVSYSLLPQLEWSLHASYRYMPSISSDRSDFEQSYQSYMIGTGIGYKF